MIQIPAHPIYDLLRYIATLMLAAAALWIYATEFDESELKSLAAFGTALGVGEFLRSQLKKKEE